ncbi:MAG: hypothetical protein RLY31_635 [Bacteroidota bacterium]|jgi:2-keto-4-pentenoate hydratase/2-oxohepta-3-ene-1,7-dioic acid hydratase in catechol pathway
MKIICIGRNYAEHARELNNPVPSNPVVFMKPSTALLANEKPFYYPDFTKDLHHELEIVLKISKNGKAVAPAFADGYFEEIGLGIDFTARDVQEQLKKKGHPWELAKAFDHSAVVGDFVPRSSVSAADGNISFSLRKNGTLVQRGDTRDMLFGFRDLVVYISKYFKLMKGDLIFTGTPAGVGPVLPGDVLEGYVDLVGGEQRRLLYCEVK